MKEKLSFIFLALGWVACVIMISLIVYIPTSKLWIVASGIAVILWIIALVIELWE